MTSAPESWGSRSQSTEGRLPDFNRHQAKPVPNNWSRSDPATNPDHLILLALKMSPSEAAIIVARFLKANSYDEV